MCFNFWQRVSTSQNESSNSLDFDSIMTENFHFSLNYVFDTIKVTTKKLDMVKYIIHINCLNYEYYFIIFYLNAIENIIIVIEGILQSNKYHG